MAGAGVLATGIAQPDDEDAVALLAAIARRRNSDRSYSPSESPESPSAASPSALALALADQLGLLLDLGLGLLLDPRRREGDDRDLLGVLGDEGDALGGGDLRRAEGCR